MEQCIFCRIACGEIPSHTVYEDEDFRVILDLGPATKGHLLILPKEHSGMLTDASDEVLQKVLPLAKRIGKALMKAMPCEGFHLVQNNGAVAGQTVSHLHFHLIPRYGAEDAVSLWKSGTLTDEIREEVLASMKKEGLDG